MFHNKEGDFCEKRSMRRFKMKAVAMALAMLCCSGMVMQTFDHAQHVESATIAELEAQKEENNKKIAQYEKELAQFEEDQKEAAAYQAALQNKIDTLQDNMEILDTELNTINENIFNLNLDIEELEATIAQQEIDIEEGLEQFKLRLRAMYVNGNDSLASALVGATDFYDLLSKYELISCVARHDDELVNNLKAELESYNANLETLNTQLAALEEELTKAEEKKAEMEASMDELQAAYQESEAEQQRLEQEEANRNKTIAELEAENQRLDDAEDEIREQIRRAEEEERKRKEKEAEEERKRQEEAAKQQQNNNNNSSGTSSGDSSYSEPSYTGTSFGWPCPGHYYISSYYGWRWGRLHKGYDIAQNKGATVVASRGGTVIAVNTGCSHNYPKSSNCCGNGYGNYVLVSHGDGYTTMYAHLQSVNVSVGESVGKGEALGTVGCTGHSTGFHLHFEIRKNGSAVNPGGYLNY